MDGLDIFILLWKPDPSIFDTQSPFVAYKIKAKHEYIVRNSNFIIIKKSPKLPELTYVLLKIDLKPGNF